MNLSIQLMTDDTLRKQILGIIREQVRPILEKMVNENDAGLTSRLVENIGKLTLRADLVRGMGVLLEKMARTMLGEAVASAFAKHKDNASQQLREGLESILKDYKARMDFAMRDITARLEVISIDKFADLVAARLAQRMATR